VAKGSGGASGGYRSRSAWLALPVGAFSALGEDQEPEGACGHARGREGLGALRELKCREPG